MKKIAVPEEGLETLFGSYDENLKHFESLFGVRIRTQGNELIVDGEDDDVAKVERTVTQLSSLLREGYRPVALTGAGVPDVVAALSA